MKALALINPRAGSIAAYGGRSWAARIERGFRDAGVEATVASIRDVALDAVLRRAIDAGADAVVAGGGDGTIGAVASALVGQAIPLGVLPLGTRNHFARDLGIPPTLDGAMRVIAAGHVTAVDVGEVNGRSFVNNSSIGLYPRLVKRRDWVMGRHGWGKWPSALMAAASALKRFPLFDVSIEVADVTIDRRTPFVFVGNNEYTIEPLRLGGRARLDAGVLSVYLPLSPSRLTMLRLALRAALGLLRDGRDFELLVARDVTVATRRRRVHAAADGELWRTKPPLRYRSRPGALHVLVPEPGP